MNLYTQKGRCGTVGSAFEEVAFQDLQVGVKYKIKSMPHHYWCFQKTQWRLKRL